MKGVVCKVPVWVEMAGKLEGLVVSLKGSKSATSSKRMEEKERRR
jgi:hypothetical protein